MSFKLTPTSYTTLRDEVVAMMLTGQIVKRELVAAYWQVGQLLLAHLFMHGGRIRAGRWYGSWF